MVGRCTLHDRSRSMKFATPNRVAVKGQSMSIEFDLQSPFGFPEYDSSFRREASQLAIAPPVGLHLAQLLANLVGQLLIGAQIHHPLVSAESVAQFEVWPSALSVFRGHESLLFQGVLLGRRNRQESEDPTLPSAVVGRYGFAAEHLSVLAIHVGSQAQDVVSNRSVSFGP